MFPLSTVVFPGVELPLHVFEDRYRRMVSDVLDEQREFGTVLITAGCEVGGGDRRSEVGTVLSVEAAVPFDDGRWLLAARGVERLRVVEWLSEDPYPLALVERLPSIELTEGSDLLLQASAAIRRLRMLLSELDHGPCCSLELGLSDDPTDAAWMACGLAPITQHDSQKLLEESDPFRRLEALLDMACGRIRDVEELLSHPSE